MRIAITGGTGFIGRSLVLRHIAAGDAVRVLSRRPGSQSGLPDAVKMYLGDLVLGGDSASLSRFVDGVDAIYHCAGEITCAGRMRLLHVEGTRKLVEAAKGNVGHWVQLSSVGAYGPHLRGVVAEETPLQPTGVYQTSKAESDQLVQQSAEDGAFSCTVLRPSLVFGPDMRNRSLRQMTATIDRGLFFFMARPGNLWVGGRSQRWG